MHTLDQTAEHFNVTRDQVGIEEAEENKPVVAGTLPRTGSGGRSSHRWPGRSSCWAACSSPAAG